MLRQPKQISCVSILKIPSSDANAVQARSNDELLCGLPWCGSDNETIIWPSVIIALAQHGPYSMCRAVDARRCSSSRPTLQSTFLPWVNLPWNAVELIFFTFGLLVSHTSYILNEQLCINRTKSTSAEQETTSRCSLWRGRCGTSVCQASSKWLPLMPYTDLWRTTKGQTDLFCAARWPGVDGKGQCSDTIQVHTHISSAIQDRTNHIRHL